ncbi:MAG: IclR family transcriptional regulator [Deltaproteobacteria bacterium]|nr:MAG: IclR family transcriptional regulator [Deltaproteobacteria bacterium]
MAWREKSNYMIQSVSHALDVLEQFQGDADEIGVTELSKKLKLHKNNVFRLLATLEARGYIEQNKLTENYRLGLRCLQLGQNYVQRMGILSQAKSTLQELAKGAKESSFVAVRKGSFIIPLDFVETQNAVRVVSLLGGTLPLHCTAAGKVYLAFDSEKGWEQNLPEHLQRYTDKTIVDRRLLTGQLKEINESGYALEQGEFMEDVVSVAVPIRDYRRALVGTLAIIGPAHRLNGERIQKETVPLILKGGTELSKRLGYQP